MNLMFFLQLCFFNITQMHQKINLTLKQKTKINLIKLSE